MNQQGIIHYTFRHVTLPETSDATASHSFMDRAGGFSMKSMMPHDAQSYGKCSSRLPFCFPLADSLFGKFLKHLMQVVKASKEESLQE